MLRKLFLTKPLLVFFTRRPLLSNSSCLGGVLVGTDTSSVKAADTFWKFSSSSSHSGNEGFGSSGSSGSLGLYQYESTRRAFEAGMRINKVAHCTHARNSTGHALSGEAVGLTGSRQHILHAGVQLQRNHADVAACIPGASQVRAVNSCNTMQSLRTRCEQRQAAHEDARSHVLCSSRCASNCVRVPTTSKVWGGAKKPAVREAQNMNSLMTRELAA